MAAVNDRHFGIVILVYEVEEVFEGVHKAIQLLAVAGRRHTDEVLNFSADRWEMPQRLQTCVKEAVQLALLVLDSEFFTQARSFERFSEQGLFESVGGLLKTCCFNHRLCSRSWR